jgi:hypothetical protein
VPTKGDPVRGEAIYRQSARGLWEDTADTMAAEAATGDPPMTRGRRKSPAARSRLRQEWR